MPSIMTHKLNLFALIGGCFLLAGTARGQTVWYVDRDASGPGHDGASWCTAFVHLQDTLPRAQPGDEVRVANGMYKPDLGIAETPGDRFASFRMRSGVALKGGYAGCGAPDPDERDPDRYLSILSGDLNGDDLPPWTESTCCHLRVAAGCDVSACEAAVCDVSQFCCEVMWDSHCASYAAELCGDLCPRRENSYHVVTAENIGPDALIDGFVITGGNATGFDICPCDHGGGMDLVASDLTVSNCVFVANEAGAGGGLYNQTLDPTGHPKLENCTFKYNHANLGGAIGEAWGQPELTGCRFVGNVAEKGGAIWSGFGDDESAIITNSLFNGNVARFDGGAIFTDTRPNLQLINSTFVWNTAGGSVGGVHLGSLTAANIVNSILWGNSDASGTGEEAQLSMLSGTPSLNNTCVQNLSGDLGGSGNMDLNPSFVDGDGADDIPGTEDDVLHLSVSSPCIDTGDDAAVVGSTDIDGCTRIVDGTRDEITRVDMGAHEFSGCPLVSPAVGLGGPSCSTGSDCTGAFAGADCVAGRCYVPKNRYLSIDPAVSPMPVAMQVQLVESAPYPGAVGRTWWVEEPVCYEYPSGSAVVPRPATCEGADRFGWVSSLSVAPLTRVWTESPLHITNCAVVPVATYEVRASADGGETFSDALTIHTVRAPVGEEQSWGDVTGGPVPGMPGSWLPPEGTTNLADVQNSIRTFENRAEDTGFPPRVWVDVEINQVVNLADISFIVMAFEGRDYADISLPLIGIDPALCP